MRSISKNLVIISYFIKISQVPYRNFAKLKQHVIVLDEQTLTGRFLLFFNNDNTQDNHDNAKKLIHNLLQHNYNYFRNLKVEDLINCLNCLETDEKAKNLLQNIDKELYLRQDYINSTEILKILNIYMKLVSNHITEYRFYRTAISKLYNDNLGNLSKSELVQFIFFVGLQKKSQKSQKIMRDCLRLMNDNFIVGLKTEELCIICNSTFKTSTKIVNIGLLQAVKIHLNNNLFLLKDPALFVTLIKTIRQNRYQDEDLLETIACTIFFNKTSDNYSFAANCHILALFSDYLYHHTALLDNLTEKCLKQLEKSVFVMKSAYLANQPRLKDIKRFIWALSNLNYILSTNHLNLIVNKVRERAAEIRDDPESLVEIILYLWMQNYRCHELILVALTEENRRKIEENRSKGQEHLSLLLHCIRIENRELFKNVGMKVTQNPTYPLMAQFKKRPVLERVWNSLKLLQCDVNRFELNCEIQFLNIVGIVGFKRKIYKTVYIEVLDQFNCTKNFDGISGLMALKLRLLRQLDEALIVVSWQEINNLTDFELQEFLLDEINLVC